MSINEAIEVLRQAGYRISKPRSRQDGTTTKWPPAKGERYLGKWPPKFLTGTTPISRLRAPYGKWMKLTSPCET
jgi:hypothetical protein